MFRLEGVHLAYGDLKVLDDFSLECRPREFICLLGPSGVGKTSILNILAGLVRPKSGSVKLPAARMGYVFQEPRLLPWCTVVENIAMGLYALKLDKKQMRRRVDDLIVRLGLSGFADYYPLQLSGGMKQRVSLGRAFAVHPDVLLMDEPFASLDDNLKQEMRGLLRELVGWRNCTTVLVTHDVRDAVELASRIVVLKGRPCREKAVYDVNSGRRGDGALLQRLEQDVVGCLTD